MVASPSPPPSAPKSDCADLASSRMTANIAFSMVSRELLFRPRWRPGRPNVLTDRAGKEKLLYFALYFNTMSFWPIWRERGNSNFLWKLKRGDYLRNKAENLIYCLVHSHSSLVGFSIQKGIVLIDKGQCGSLLIDCTLFLSVRRYGIQYKSKLTTRPFSTSSARRGQKWVSRICAHLARFSVVGIGSWKKPPKVSRAFMLINVRAFPSVGASRCCPHLWAEKSGTLGGRGCVKFFQIPCPF